MKFSLRLDESLFDDIDSDTLEINIKNSEFDDDFSTYYDEHNVEDVPRGPLEGSDTGVADQIIALIHDEWEAIQGYNNAIAALRALVNSNPFYETAISVLEEINSEENAHVGQLQEVLKQISPNVEKIEEGEAEAKSQMGLVGGILPVQSWDQSKSSTVKDNSNCEDELCTITEVDDEM